MIDASQCCSKTWLNAQVADGKLELPQPSSAMKLASRAGELHESASLANLERVYGKSYDLSRVPIRTAQELYAADRATLAAMESGHRLISQPTFADPSSHLTGRADFLVRVDNNSQPWGWGYEVYDAKLARTAKTQAAVQVAFYTTQVARLQGCIPKRLHLILGTEQIHTMMTADICPYWESLVQRWMRVPPSEPYPNQCTSCSTCDWQQRCETIRNQADDLTLVHGLRADQRERLRRCGITTSKDLSESATPPNLLPASTFLKLRRQAAAQLASKATGTLQVELNPDQTALPATGLSRLRQPNPGDLFFDFEGDPFYDKDGLEYMIGVSWQDPSAPGGFGYQAFWAHDRAAERQLLIDFVEFVESRRASNPDLSLYHYAPYERTALHKLSHRHLSCEDIIGQWLSSGLLVDLYQVVHEGLIVGDPSYSLKVVEQAYRTGRTGGVTKAIGSVEEYESWRADGASHRLASIERYNRDDCISTAQLFEWLHHKRLELATPASFAPPPQLTPKDLERTRERQQYRDRLSQLSTQLLDAAAQSSRIHEANALRVLSGLVLFFSREHSASWRDWYALTELTPEAAAQSDDALVGLVHVEEVGTEKKSQLSRYSYPAQSHPFRNRGETLYSSQTQKRVGEVWEVDFPHRSIVIKHTAGKDLTSQGHFIKEGPPSVEKLEQRVVDLATRALTETLQASDLAIIHLLDRQSPTIHGHDFATPLINTDRTNYGPNSPAAIDVDTQVIELAKNMVGTHLAIQGPPGAGKTRLGVELIVSLCADNKTVGVVAPSHAVAVNLLSSLSASHPHIRIGHRHPAPLAGSAPANDTKSLASALAFCELDVVSGTAWTWADQSWLAEPVDTLVVDEAGQFSLAHLAAIAASAKNLILLGDPQQLPQVTKSQAHTHGANLSAMSYLCQDTSTIDETLGVFLDRTWRMRPELTATISAVAYGGRLFADDSTSSRMVTVEGTPQLGVQFYPVNHSGNRTASPEEAKTVVDIVGKLLDCGKFTDNSGTRHLTPQDFCFVAPFNAQVRCLSEHLEQLDPRFAGRIGSVDKFQGRQAIISVYSLAASSTEQLDRGTAFLYDTARLNVALSRAQCFSILVASPGLIGAPVDSLAGAKGAGALFLATSPQTDHRTGPFGATG